ncbi:MAG TPA: molybdate ABC transporter substrate-binding protein [Methanoregulaceae archaeon]|nr:molybdate ABC transporter substrate-binding protein [Methanoregulaceae archaeon]
MTVDKKSVVISALLSIILCIVLVTTGCTNTATTPGATPGTTITTQKTAPPTQASAKTLIVFTAASLKGASDVIGPAYSNATPGTTVKFNLDGTQVLKQQLENGAKADVLISASNTYTNALKNEGYLVNETVKNLTSNYIIVIVPAGNPGHINSLADLGTPGKKIAMGTPDVPVGVNTRQSIAKLTNSTFNTTWNTTLFKNVVSYETQEPGVVTKVVLGEVDAGFVYESSYKAAQPGTLNAIVIPVKDNSLQTYTIGITNTTSDKDAAFKFETFMVSPQGQQILSDFGFRPIGG